jgi:hypothetical protein
VSRSEPSPKRLTRLQLRLRGEADEVENPKEATSVSREIGCAPSVEEPWGPDDPVSTRPDRRRARGGGLRSCGGQAGEARRLAGAKPKEAPTWTPG